MTDARADELESKLAQGDKLTPGDVKGWEWVLLQQEFERHVRQDDIPLLVALREIEGVESFYPGCEAFLRRIVQEAPLSEEFWQHPRWPKLVRLASRFLVVSRHNVDFPDLAGIMPHAYALPRSEEVLVILKRIMATQGTDDSIEDAIAESFSPRPFWGSRLHQSAGGEVSFLLSIFVGLDDGGFWNEKVDSNEEWIAAWREENLRRIAHFAIEEGELDEAVSTIVFHSRRSVMEDRLLAYLRLYSVDNAWTVLRDGDLLFLWNGRSRSMVFTTNVDPDRVIDIAGKHQAAWTGFTHDGEWVTWIRLDRVLAWIEMARGLTMNEFNKQANISAMLSRYQQIISPF